MLLKLEGPGQFSCDCSWSSLASQVQQTDIIRLPLVWCSEFLGKFDPWPHFHHAYHSALGQDLLNLSVTRLPPSNGLNGISNDTSQRDHLSAGEILLWDSMVQFLWDIGVCGSSIAMMSKYPPTSYVMSETTPKLLFTIWAARPMGDQDKGDHIKVRDALNKTNWNFLLPKGQKGASYPAYLRAEFLALHKLEGKYALPCPLFH